MLPDAGKLRLHAQERLGQWNSGRDYRQVVARSLARLSESAESRSTKRVRQHLFMLCEDALWAALLQKSVEDILAGLLDLDLVGLVAQDMSSLLSKNELSPVTSAEAVFDQLLWLSTFQGPERWLVGQVVDLVRFEAQGCSSEYQAIADRALPHFSEDELLRDIVGDQRLTVLVRCAFREQWNGLLQVAASYPEWSFDPRAQCDWVTGRQALTSLARWKLTGRQEDRRDVVFWLALCEVRWALAKLRIIDALGLPIAQFFLLQWTTHRALGTGRVDSGGFSLNLERAFDTLDELM